MIGQYMVMRQVKDLPHGYEFQHNKRIFRDSENYHGNGCYVENTSADGKTTSFAMSRTPYSSYQDVKVWLEGGTFINCMIDFVPDSHRELWVQLQKLGYCYLEFLPYEDGAWQVSYPENHSWMTKFYQGSDGDFNLTDRYTPTTGEAIINMIEEFRDCELVHNGSRWFDCRDVGDFKKISDDEAKKLMEE